MSGIVQKKPVQRLFKIPLYKLPELIPHKIEFLARMRELICKKKPQLFKLLFVTALHAVYQG